MKIVKVTYTVQPEFADQNKENVRRVMQALKEAGSPGIRYTTYVKEDGVTFVHMAHFENEEANKSLGELPAFKAFQQALRDSGPVSPPNAEPIELVGNSKSLFD